MKLNANRIASRGVTLVETTVALGLLAAAMSVMASLAVRNGRLLADNRAYRVAVDELSNHLERLAAMPANEAATAIKALTDEAPPLSLSQAKIRGEIEAEDFGHRLTLTLSWPNTVKRRPDMSLVAWSYFDDKNAGGQP